MELPKGPSYPCCNSRSSPTYPSPLERKHESPAHIQRSPVSASQLERRYPFPVCSGKNSLCSRHISRRGDPTGKPRGTPGSCHHSQSPPDVSVHSRETCFPSTASTFKPRIDSQHGGTWESPVGQPCGKASCESLVGNIEGKPRGKATDPLIHAKGSVTLLLQLGRKAHVHAPCRDED